MTSNQLSISRRRPTETAAPVANLSDEQRAAIAFVGGLQAAGVDWGRGGAGDEMLVPTLAAAGLLGLKQQTLALWRCDRMSGLPHVQVGRRIFYRLGDLRRFIANRTQQPRQAC